jgi:aldehyde:ferredoxin oxidoreductase
MDTISMGATIACAMELVERGYLKEDQVSTVNLRSQERNECCAFSLFHALP